MSRRKLAGDTRAVAPVIGFIFLTGVLVLFLGIYQTQVVPQQNAETELEHHEDTRYELQSLHNAISAVSETAEPRFQSITLGTTYDGRTVAVNPPPPAGTIRTEQHNISIANESGAEETIPTQFIEYQPGYNELDIGSTWYENSVLYFDERDRGNSVGIIEDQKIVEDGNVTVVALQNEFEEMGTRRVTLELYNPSNMKNISLPEDDGNYTVTVPTRINGTEYWDDALADAGEIYQGVDDTNNDKPYMINLSIDPDNIEINTVGIRKEVNNVVDRSDPTPDIPDRFERGSGEYREGNFDNEDVWDEDGNLVTEDLERSNTNELLGFFTVGNVNISGNLIIELQREDVELITFGDFYIGGRLYFQRPGQSGEPNILIETRGDTIIEDEVVFENPESTIINSLGSFTLNDRLFFDGPQDDIFIRVDDDLSIEGTFEIDPEIQGQRDDLDVHIFVDGDVDVGSVDFSNTNLILYGDTDYQVLENQRDESRDKEDFPIDQL